SAYRPRDRGADLIEKPTTSGTRSKKTTCRRVGRPRNKGLHRGTAHNRQTKRFSLFKLSTTKVHVGL
ncbi:hypothetical protein U9M48_008367, partial [Paspalum notatum var. saurae]